MALELRCPVAASPLPARAPFPNSSSAGPPGPRLPRRFAGAGGCRCHYYHGDGPGRVPKQFREENLKDGLMDNYKNVPQLLYGLSPSLMEMFLTDSNPYNRQSMKVRGIPSMSMGRAG